MVPPVKLVARHDSRTDLVNGLPVELLTLIFGLCGPAETLTWVCQHWRDAALGCLQLWTRIAVVGSRKTLAYLERSGKLPLAVYLKMDNRTKTKARLVNIREGLQLVFATSSHRVRDIYVDLDCVSNRDDTPRDDGVQETAALFDALVHDVHEIMANFDLTRVQILDLNVRLEEEYGPHLAIPPNLKYLCLNGMGEDIRLLPLTSQSLAALHISCTAVWANVLDAALSLSNMPGLKELCLLNYEEDPQTCPVMGDEPYEPAALERITVRLPKLRKLRLRLRLSEANHFLNTLNIPLATRWVLMLQSD